MKIIKKVAIFLFVAVIDFTTASLSAADNNEAETLAVTVITLGKVAIPVERDVEAELVSLNDTPISSELAARVEEINVAVGDQVHQDDVLALLDCRDYEVSLRQAKAGVATVKARIAATAALTGASESRVNAATSRANAAVSRVNAAVSQVSAMVSQAKAAGSQINAAKSRVNAAAARGKATTATMQSTGTRINTAKSRVHTAKAQAVAANARIPAALGQFKLAQAQLKRNQQLRARKLIAADLFEQSQASFDSAQSNLGAAKAEAAAAQAAVLTANAEISSAQGDFRASQAQVEAGNADVASAKAEVAINQANLETSKANVATNKANADVSTAEVDVAKADVETAKSEWEAAKADLIAAETELETALAQQEAAEVIVERCEITAPFAGQITERSFQLGQVAAPGTSAFQILQTDELEVVASLSADEIKDQEKSESVWFVAEGDELAIERRAVIARVDQATATQEVRFSVKDLHSFPVGKNGRLRWQGKLPALPADWLLQREGGLGVMLAVDGKAEFHPLKNAREGQPALIDLPAETLLIDANRLRARNGQAIERTEQ